MKDPESFTNQQKRIIGESHARALIGSRFREVFDQVTDEGIDVMGCGFEGQYTEQEPIIRFQVKLGSSYLKGIRIAPETLRYLVSRVEDEPVFFLHYSEIKHDDVPDYFLIFHRWLIAHAEDVSAALEAEEDLWIPHMDLQPLSLQSVDDLWRACKDEIARCTGSSRSILVRRRPHFSSYHLFRHFQHIALNWDLALLCGNKHILGLSQLPESLISELQHFWEKKQVNPILADLFRVRDYHPLARTPKSVIHMAQGHLLRAFAAYDDGKEFTLSNRFDVVHVAAARTLASRYPRIASPVLQVLSCWRGRTVQEVLVALQMASTLSLFDASNKEAFINTIRRLVQEVYQACPSSLEHYQLLHHAYEVLGEVGEDLSNVIRAVEFAKSNMELELLHLSTYGWGVGPHVVLYYKRALERAFLSGNTVAQEYNQRMHALMANEIG